MATWIPAAIMAGAAIGGGLISLWSSWQGMKKELEESRRAERVQIELYERQTAEERAKEKREMEYGRQSERRQMRFQKEEKMKDRNYSTYQSFMDRMVGQMNAKPQLAANLIQLQKARM